ncbi:hypothetical protein ACX80E_00430 [Arthrobacter sp. TMN-49]
MSLEGDIHRLVLGLDGIATVYSVDPLWMTVVKELGSLLASGAGPAQVPFVVCTEEYEADDAAGDGRAPRPVMNVKVRIGTDGSVPAPALARSVAALIRAHVAQRRPEMDVRAVVQIAAIAA